MPGHERLIKDWYQDGVCAVKVGGKVSSQFNLRD